jgi:hypothetical protein
MVAWRRFLIETLLCLVLVGAIAIVALRAGHAVLTGPTIAVLVAAILGILWK